MFMTIITHHNTFMIDGYQLASFTYLTYIIVENILINNEILSEDLNGLFVFEYEITKLNSETLQVNLIEDIEGSYYEVSVTLSMNLPTHEQYSVIAGQQLAFEFTSLHTTGAVPSAILLLSNTTLLLAASAKE